MADNVFRIEIEESAAQKAAADTPVPQPDRPRVYTDDEIERSIRDAEKEMLASVRALGASLTGAEQRKEMAARGTPLPPPVYVRPNDLSGTQAQDEDQERTANLELSRQELEHGNRLRQEIEDRDMQLAAERLLEREAQELHAAEMRRLQEERQRIGEERAMLDRQEAEAKANLERQRALDAAQRELDKAVAEGMRQRAADLKAAEDLLADAMKGVNQRLREADQEAMLRARAEALNVGEEISGEGHPWARDPDTGRMLDPEEMHRREQAALDEQNRRLMQDPANQILGRIHGRDMAWDHRQSELDALRDLSRRGLLDEEEERRMDELARALTGGGEEGPRHGMGSGMIGGGMGAGFDLIYRAAMGGFGGAGGALGVAGGTMMLGSAIQKELREMEMGFHNLNREVGQTTKMFAALDAGGMANSLVKIQQVPQAMADFLPVWNPFLEGLAKASNVTAIWTQNAIESINALDATAKKIGVFHGESAAELGMAQARAVMGDIRRGQLLGPELAGFIEAKSKLEQSAMDVMADLVLKSGLIPLTTRLLTGLRVLVEKAPKTAEDIINWQINNYNLWVNIYNILKPFFFKAAKHIDKVDFQTKPTKDAEMFLDQMMRETRDQLGI